MARHINHRSSKATPKTPSVPKGLGKPLPAKANPRATEARSANLARFTKRFGGGEVGIPPMPKPTPPRRGGKKPRAS